MKEPAGRPPPSGGKRPACGARLSEDRPGSPPDKVRIIPWEAEALTWRFTSVGPQAVEVLGHPLEAWYEPDFWRRHIHPEDRERVLRFCRDASEHRLEYDLEYRMVAADGRSVWLHDVVAVIHNTAGSNLHRGFLIDMTDHRHAQEERRRREKQYRDLVETSNDLIWAVDAEGCWTFLNRAAARRIYGYEPEEMIGRPFTDFMTAERARKDLEEFARVKSGQPCFQYETEHHRKDGQPVYLSFNAIVLRDEGGHVVGTTGTACDVTERKRLEERMRQAQKMEAVGRLAGGVAHDFNNLLTAITGYTELILSALRPTDSLYRDALAVKKAADQATVLTRQLLAFGRKQVLAPKVLDLNTSVAALSEVLLGLIGAHIELVTDLAPDLGLVRADPGQLQQVLLNLAVNARDAMPSGGRLTLSTANVSLPAGRRGAAEEPAPGPYVRLAVSDTGVGMSDEVRACLFEPFFTTKELGKGTGLGLSTVYGIVKQSGGHVEVVSAPGQGTTFHVYLPRASDAVALPEKGVPPPRPVVGRETVLLVEDEPLLRALFGSILRQQGYAVREVADGVEALEWLARRGTKIDLLVTDMVMPRMNGWQLAERMLAEQPGLKVLFISGHTQDHGAQAAARAFLQKPFDADALARKVREVLDG
jgi:two-component system, cell cycle sensor histidine kinase and response regulator CckA